MCLCIILREVLSYRWNKFVIKNQSRVLWWLMCVIQTLTRVKQEDWHVWEESELQRKTLLQKFKSEGGVELHSHVRVFSEQMEMWGRKEAGKKGARFLSRLPLLLLGDIWETDFPLTSWPSARNTGVTLDCSDGSGAFLFLPFTKPYGCSLIRMLALFLWVPPLSTTHMHFILHRNF